MTRSSRLLYELTLVSFAVSLAARGATFKNPALIDTTYDPIGVASADANHDGKSDLLYIDSPGSPTLHVLLGNGDGTFSHSQDLALPAGTCGYSNCMINLADVTKDGNLDIILGNGTLDIFGGSTAQMVEFSGNGDGTFKSPVISTVANFPPLNGQMAIGDLNGDGAMDVVAVSGYYLDVFLGNNSGKFTLANTQTLYFSGGSTIYLYDLNGDGHLDIIANDLPGGRTFVLLGNGDGTFQPAVSYNTSFAWLFADMDGDGHPDLVGSRFGQGVMVSKGNPDGTFGSAISVANIPAGDNLITVADYNADGILDLVLYSPTGIAVALGQGNLTYAAPVTSVAGALATPFLGIVELASSDFNGDGHNDLAMGVDGGILILPGNGIGGFASADYYDVGHPVGVASVADFNNDGEPDIAVSVSATYPRLLLGSGSGTFTLGADQNQSYNSQNPSSNMQAADFNGDGRTDVVFVQPSSSFPYGQSFVLFNNGNNRFSNPLAISAGPTFAGDVNGDGHGDLLFIGNGGISVLLGQTNSTFGALSTPLRYAANGIAAIGDLNHDGKPDLLTYEYPGLRLWVGNGDGTFTPSNLISVPVYFYGGQPGTIADIDGDGNQDFIAFVADPAPGAYGVFVVLYGNGDGTFQPAVEIPASHLYTLLKVADVDRDNKPDLVVSDGSGIAVLTNLGNRSFSPEDHYVAGQGISQLNVVDVNGDGFPDIVAANSGGTTVTVLLNQPNRNPLDGISSAGKFTISPSPSNYGQPVTLKLSITATAGAGVPTGFVTFYVDGTYISLVPLVAGTASYVDSQVLPTGSHTFIAAYNGDSTYAAESFAALQTINPPVYATNTVLVASPTTVMASQTVRLTATVSSSVTVPAGTVTFMDGPNSLGAQPVDATGVSLLDTATLTAGAHQLRAAYQGYQDPFNLQAVYQPSTSSAVTVMVNTKSTSTALSASSLSSTSGTVVTFTATVVSGTAVPFGGVSFYDGASLLGTMSLVSSKATFNTASLSLGSHSITAVFNANGPYAASTSPALILTVAAASAGLAPSLIVAKLHNNSGRTSLTAKVIAETQKSGFVTFLDNGNVLGVVPVDASGNAVLPLSSFSNMRHSLSVSLSGSSQIAPASDPEFAEQWPTTGPGFSMVLSSDSVLMRAGQSGQLAIQIIPLGSLQRSVQLTCVPPVPTGYSCVFSPPSLPGAGTSRLMLLPDKVPNAASGSGKALYGIAVGLFAFCFKRVKRHRHSWTLLLVVVVNLSMSGCGNSSAPVDVANQQIITIEATSGSGPTLVIHSAQVIIGQK